MRKLVLAVPLLFLAVTTQASPKNIRRIVTAPPRAVGRTAENMVMFKDRRLALNQWILMAAVLVDTKTSFDLARRCAQPCENYSFVWGAHPRAPRVYGLLGLTGFYYSTLNQVGWEVSYEETDPAGRLFERYVFLFPAVLHGWFAFRNAQIQPRGANSSQWQSNLPPELRMDHSIAQ